MNIGLEPFVLTTGTNAAAYNSNGGLIGFFGDQRAAWCSVVHVEDPGDTAQVRAITSANTTFSDTADRRSRVQVFRLS